MFYHLIGELVTTEPNAAVIDCGGVGYKLTISQNTLAKLSSQKTDKKKVRLFTHLAIREDAVELFGFFEQEELNAFKMLITVSGVGPKAAMGVLSIMTPEKFALAVGTSDAKALSKAPGVGGKTAARIILELKDKIAKELSAADDGESDSGFAAVGSDKYGDAVNALLVLGYSRSEAMTVLRGIDVPALSLEEIIKESLKKLMKQ